MIFKVPSNPYHAMILWFYDLRGLFLPVILWLKKNRVKHQRNIFLKKHHSLHLPLWFIHAFPSSQAIYFSHFTSLSEETESRREKTFCRTGDYELSSRCLQDCHKSNSCFCFLKTYLLKQSLRFLPLPKCHFLPLLWIQLYLKYSLQIWLLSLWSLCRQILNCP